MTKKEEKKVHNKSSWIPSDYSNLERYLKNLTTYRNDYKQLTEKI